MSAVPSIGDQDPISLPEQATNPGLQQSAISPENAGKFVARYPKASSMGLGKIDTIRAHFTKELNKFQERLEKVRFRVATTKEMTGFALDLETSSTKNDTLTTLTSQLYGRFGVDKHIAADPRKIIEVKKLEIELKLALKRVARLKAHCESGSFKAAYDFLKQITGEFLGLVNSPDTQRGTAIQTFRDRVKYIKDNFENLALPAQPYNRKELLKFCASRELYLEMLALCLFTAERLKQGSNASQTAVISDEITNLKKAETVAKTQLQNLPKKPTVVTNPKIVASAELEKFKQAGGEFGFWQHAPTSLFGSKYVRGSKETETFGETLENDLGGILKGLLEKIEARLGDFCQGQLTPIEGKESLKEEVDHYGDCLSTVGVKLRGKIDALRYLPYDALTGHVFDYVYGMQKALFEARDILKMAYKFTTDEAVTVLKAIKGIQMLEQEPSEDTSDALAELEATERLFRAIQEMRRAKEAAPHVQNRYVDQFLSRTVQQMEEVHAQVDPTILSLTEEEKEVFDWVMAGKSMDRFYHEGETKTMLPFSVLSFIAKLQLSYLYLPAEAHDMKLELFLHKLNNNQPLKKLFESSSRPGFTAIATAYEAVLASKRGIDLKPASSIYSTILQADGQKRDLVAYARASQRLIEFSKRRPAAAAEQLQFDLLQKVLAVRLEAGAQTHGYWPIYPEILKTDLDMWKTANPKMFLEQLSVAQGKANLSVLGPVHRQMLFFDSLVLRALCACLDASEYREQDLAQEKIADILSKKEYEGFVSQLSSDTMQLLHENTKQKILDCSLQKDEEKILPTPREIALYIDGPVKEFFQSDSWDLDTLSVQMVLFKLIKQERSAPVDKRPLSARFIETEGQEEFDHWYQSFEDVQMEDPVSRLFIERVFQETQNPAKNPRGVLSAPLQEVFGREQFVENLMGLASRHGIPQH